MKVVITVPVCGSAVAPFVVITSTGQQLAVVVARCVLLISAVNEVAALHPQARKVQGDDHQFLFSASVNRATLRSDHAHTPPSRIPSSHRRCGDHAEQGSA